VKKVLIVLLSFSMFSLSAFAFDASEFAKGTYEKAKGNKTEKQWKRYFGNPKWQVKLGIDTLSDADKAALLSYLNARSAEKDQATVPQ